jgi:hypothetical protein
MSDTLVLDMSTQSEGAAAVFTKRDWLTILDNQNQNYQGNQCVIDTSQLANSNKYMNYREAYLTIPMLITLTSVIGGTTAPTWGLSNADPNNTSSPDWCVGLKNWYGSIIHSFTLDYNGTTIIQQTPYIGLWNTFKLMTSLSLDDVKTQGSLIGFYPDYAGAASFQPVASLEGIGVCNNNIVPQEDAEILTSFQTNTAYWSQSDTSVADVGVNVGLYKRIQAWNFDSGGAINDAPNAVMPLLIPAVNASLIALWQSYVLTKVSGAGDAPTTGAGVYQVAILGIVYLKHVASFFERIPLVKGVFMKLTLNLNQTSVNYTIAGSNYSNVVVNSPLGGVSPLMLLDRNYADSDSMPNSSYILSLAVGGRCLNSSQSGLAGVTTSQVGGGSITLNVPAYTFNPVFEQSYLSSPVKKVVYSDVYQYQIVNLIGANSTFNNLVTNGIANIKSVLVLPFFSAGALTGATGNIGLLPIQSPFDPAGGGPTSPLVAFTQFNIQISGQNAIYNTERYAYEQFANQFKGVNAINGGQTDGLTSGLIGYKDWTQGYSYYYVNCGRMLPVEESVPKSVNVLGQNMSARPVDLYIFVEYGVEVSIDILTGSRV